MADQGQLPIERVATRHAAYLRPPIGPPVEHRFFLSPASEQKNSDPLTFRQPLHHLLHLCRRVNLARVTGEGRNAHPPARFPACHLADRVLIGRLRCK